MEVHFFFSRSVYLVNDILQKGSPHTKLLLHSLSLTIMCRTVYFWYCTVGVVVIIVGLYNRAGVSWMFMVSSDVQILILGVFDG